MLFKNRPLTVCLTTDEAAVFDDFRIRILEPAEGRIGEMFFGFDELLVDQPGVKAVVAEFRHHAEHGLPASFDLPRFHEDENMDQAEPMGGVFGGG